MKGKSNTSQYLRVSNNYHASNTGNVVYCEMPSNWDTLYFGNLNTLLERNAVISGTNYNSPTACINTTKINQEAFTISLVANTTYNPTWWADIDNLQIAFDYTSPSPAIQPMPATDTNGALWQWDRDKDYTTKSANLDRIIALSPGYGHELALKADGTVWAWGQNSRGQIGDGTSGNVVAEPTRVKGPGGIGYLTDITAIAGGGSFSMALRKDGTVWIWGSNPNSLRGTGDGTGTVSNNLVFPTQVKSSNASFLTDVIAITAGSEFSLALKNDGTVWGWGDNHNKQIGFDCNYFIPTNCYQAYYPKQTKNISNVKAITAGYSHSIAIKNDETVWGWGDVYSNQLGNVNTVPNASGIFSTIIPGLTNIQSVSAFGNYTVAVDTNGGVYHWGYQVPDPVKIQQLSGIKSVSSGGSFGVGLASDGSVWNWWAINAKPTKITNLSNVSVIDVAVYFPYSMAVVGDGTATPPQSSKTPVILIPGIMGSEFEVKEILENEIKNCIGIPYSYSIGDTVWVNRDLTQRLDDKSCGNYLNSLALNNLGTPIHPEIALKQNIVNANILGEHIGYFDTLPFFTEIGYVFDKDLFIFPYDWRKDLAENISLLDAKINAIKESSGKEKVQLVAHSMGGLVAKDYIRDPEHAQKVDTLVTLGTPHVGAPSMLAHLLYNKCFKGLYGIEAFIVGECAINGNELNKLAQNFPGIFELLPSSAYYQLYNDSSEYPFNDKRDIDSNQTKGPLSYVQTNEMLLNLGKNMSMFENAEAYHNMLDASYHLSDKNVTDINGVKTYMIVGSGQPTIGQITDYTAINLFNFDGGYNPIVNKQDATAINGDDTVPLLSASLGKTNHVYYVNQTHGSLQTGTSLQMAYNLLQGQIQDIPGVQAVPYNFSGKIISVHSPVLIHAYDAQGRHTGPKDDGTIEVAIPGSSYDELGESKFIYLPSGDNYNVKTKATAEGSFDLKIKTYADSEISKEQLYLTVPQTANTTATMTLDTENPILKVDTDNNGSVDKDINVTSTITGDDLTDIQAPTTTIQATGTQGTNDWYISDVLLSFTEEDAGAGILKTYYYKDGEQTIHEATTPKSLDTEGTAKIWYFSVDKAGNTEQPKSITVKIDKTAPAITYTDRTDPNTNGWNNTDVTVNWTCTDTVSGVIDEAISKTLTTEGKDQSVTGTCTDNAGNQVIDTQTGIYIDKTPPTAVINTPKDNEKYILKSNLSANWTATDGLSGIDTQTGTYSSGDTMDTTKVGSHTFEVTTTDYAGNTTKVTNKYTIIYRFDGFLQPINDTGHTQICGDNCTVSIFKGGSTVPIKFQLKDATGNIVQSATTPQWVIPQKGNGLTSNINESELLDAEDSSSVYNWNGSLYHYNWNTKDAVDGYFWQIGTKLDDGQIYMVNVGLR